MGSLSRLGPLGLSRGAAEPGAEFAPSSDIVPYSVLSVPGPWTLDMKGLV